MSETRPPAITGDSRSDALKAWNRYRLHPVGAVAQFMLCVLVAVGAAWFARDLHGLAPAPARMLFILVLATLLWLLEVIPAFAVGILIIALQILLLGNPDQGIYAEHADDWETFVVVLGHPLIWLFFGGFVLGAAIAKTGLDQTLARNLLRTSGRSPGSLLFGVMTGSMALSMFMSNTATTTMMLAIVAPMLANRAVNDRFAKALLLGVPVAANLGGMGTIIGSPPNAIAVGALAKVPGEAVSFIEWMLMGLPPALLLFFIAWFFLRLHYGVRTATLGEPGSLLDTVTSLSGTPADVAAHPPAWQRVLATGTLVVTVGLWMTGQWTDIPTAVVSFLPIAIFTATGILREQDVRRLPWDVLLLLAGGLALGNGVRDTGLAAWLVEALPLSAVGELGMILILCYATVVLSNLMSNTAAANILVPITIVMASGFESIAVVPLALCASCAMCLPISTPPNAIAFASGRLRTQDFLPTGLLVGALAPPVTVGWMLLVKSTVL